MQTTAEICALHVRNSVHYTITSITTTGCPCATRTPCAEPLQGRVQVSRRAARMGRVALLPWASWSSLSGNTHGLCPSPLLPCHLCLCLLERTSLFSSPVRLFRRKISLAGGPGLAVSPLCFSGGWSSSAWRDQLKYSWWWGIWGMQSLRSIFFFTAWVLVLRWSRYVKACSSQGPNVHCGRVAVPLLIHLFCSSVRGSELWERPSRASPCTRAGRVGLPKSWRAEVCTLGSPWVQGYSQANQLGTTPKCSWDQVPFLLKSIGF